MTRTIGRAGRVRGEQGAKRVRVYVVGEVVADTTRPRLVWEVPSYPAYYLPVENVRTELMVATATVTHSPSRGDAQHFTVKVYTHPRDPYTRVDILATSRRVRIEVDGVVLAESTGARVLVGDRLVRDLAWSYRTPLPESQKVAGLVAFYSEKVDLYVDGQLQQRPVTKFSK
jgi:uncharacterized protein (DUF427 family)